MSSDQILSIRRRSFAQSYHGCRHKASSHGPFMTPCLADEQRPALGPRCTIPASGRASPPDRPGLAAGSKKQSRGRQGRTGRPDTGSAPISEIAAFLTKQCAVAALPRRRAIQASPWAPTLAKRCFPPAMLRYRICRGSTERQHWLPFAAVSRPKGSARTCQLRISPLGGS